MRQWVGIIIFLFLIIGCDSSHGDQYEGFILKGKTNGIKDGTIVQLFDVLSEKIIDSTVIRDNAFLFKGKLDRSPASMILKIKDLSQYKYIWMENTVMTFDASNSNFRNAEFLGSQIHEWAYEKLFRRTDTIQVNSLEDLNRVREIEMNFVEEYPDNIISANILSVYATEFKRQRIERLYDSLSKKAKESIYGERVQKFLELNTNSYPGIGSQFIDFKMATVEGDTAKFSDHLKEVTLLEFWASNCGPCRKENPNLIKTYEEFKSEGFEIFAVSLDTKMENWKEAITQDNLPWTQVSDLEGSWNSAALVYGVGTIPDNFLIDKNGRIIGRNLRGERLKLELRDILQK